MKKFTKLFLSCAAMAAVTAAVATSAMAAAPTISATYEDANLNGELTLSVQGATGEVTLLVTEKALTETIADDDILYIDQATNGAFAQKVVLRKKGTEATQYLPDGKYNVYVGYTDGDEFKVATNTFRVGAGSDVEIGNVNGDEAIDPADAVLVVQHFGGVIELTGDQYTAANANGDEAVDPADAVCIVRRFAGLSDGIGLIVPPQN